MHTNKPRRAGIRLRVLLVEDSPPDADLVVRCLRQAGFDPRVERVETKADYLAQLDRSPDLILSDFCLPEFSATEALALLQARGLDIPFIIVSGTIGEDTAVEAMKQGAADYVLKDRLSRLGQAVEHALEEHRVRRAQLAAERAWRESEERFRQLTESIHEVFWLAEPDGRRMLYVSPAYTGIWGRLPGSATATPSGWRDTVHDEDRERIVQARQALRSRRGYDEEYRIFRPDGAVRWIRERAFPVHDDDGVVCRLAGVSEDVTEHKQLESHLLRAQRVDAIGTLAGGVAHDLNNILSPMFMAAGLMKETVTDPHHRDLLDLIERSVERGAAIIRQLLTFCRGTDGERIAVSPNVVLQEIVALIRETFPREITLVERVPENLWTVESDATGLHQVLMNLCLNARDAMPDGGRLTLTAENVELTDAEALARSGTKGGVYVVLTVSDTGVGIPPEIVDRIFDPFFTTKPPGRGTGLGLSTVLGIVHRDGGFVHLASLPGQGSVFAAHLPASRKVDVERAAEATAAMSVGGGEGVLVVDDEPAVRDMIAQILRGQNYHVLVAANGVEALEVFQEHRGEVQLVLSDLMMPRMGGLPLARALRSLEPQLKIITMSGLAADDRHAELRSIGVTDILPKPCGGRVLLEAVGWQLRPTTMAAVRPGVASETEGGSAKSAHDLHRK